MKLWDNFNKRWLEISSIIWDSNGQIVRITAIEQGADPLKDGWFEIKGEDLERVAINGAVKHNEHLIG